MVDRGSYTRIVGLSERRQLPRLGKIRLGVKMQTSAGKEYPREASYFVCPPEVRKVYGDQPTELDIMFPVEDGGAFFPQALKWYSGTQKLKCKGDGATALRGAEYCEGDNKDGLIEVTCPCDRLDNGCSAKGCLMVLLPKVSIGGVYQVDTGSGANIIRINSFIDFLRDITRGRVSLIPLKLRRVEESMPYRDKDGKDKKSKHYLLQIELPLTLDDVARLRADNQMILPASQYLLPAPVEDGRDYPEVIVQEQELFDAEIPEPQPKRKEEKMEGAKRTPSVSDVGDMLLELSGGSKTDAANLLRSMTTYVDKNGVKMEGRESLKGISERQLLVVYGKAKALCAERERQQQEIEADPPPDRWKDADITSLQQARVNLGWAGRKYLQIAAVEEDEGKLMDEALRVFDASLEG